MQVATYPKLESLQLHQFTAKKMSSEYIQNTLTFHVLRKGAMQEIIF